MANWSFADPNAEFKNHLSSNFREEPSPDLKWERGLIFSVLLHLALVIGFYNRQDIPVPQKVLNVSLEKLFKAPKKQIVSPSAKSNQKPNPNSKRLSDLDNVVASESIKRGDSPTAGQKSIPQKATPPSKSKTKSEQKNRQKNTQENIETKKPVAKDTVKNTAKDSTKNKPVTKSIQQKDGVLLKKPENAYQEKTAANLANALAGTTIGKQGSPDHLPDVQDGEITLLNTKASVYAVFVRRVAMQVFSQLKQAARYGLSYAEINSMGRPATIRAVLDKDGNLIQAFIAQESLSGNFNQLMLKSVQSKASDPHPPAAALNADNQFVFIFQSIMQSQKIPLASSRGMREKRWIMLRVGLE